MRDGDAGSSRCRACGTATVVCAGLLGLAACDTPSDDEPDPQGDPWFQVGSGETSFTPLEPAGVLPIVWGSQGAAMFPMPIRGGGFHLPGNPKDFGHPEIPILDLVLDIDGYSDDPATHFKQISNYPVTFDVLPDGTYEYFYLPVIVPDAVVDPQIYHGSTAHLRVELTPFQAETMLEEYALVVDVAPPG